MAQRDKSRRPTANGQHVPLPSTLRVPATAEGARSAQELERALSSDAPETTAYGQ
jgi:hypothetical protein